MLEAVRGDCSGMLEAGWWGLFYHITQRESQERVFQWINYLTAFTVMGVCLYSARLNNTPLYCVIKGLHNA